MVSGTLTVLIGLLAVVIAIFMLLIEVSYPTAYCVGGEVIEKICINSATVMVGILAVLTVLLDLLSVQEQS